MRFRLFSICIAFLLLATWLSQSPGAQPVQTSVLADDGNRIVLEFSFDDPVSRSVTIGGESYEEFRLPGEPLTMEKGAPALPHVNRSVIVPGNAEMAVRLLDATYHEIFARIAPSKGTLSRSVDPQDVPYEFGGVYRTSTLYPGPLATLGRPYIMRDARGVVVQVNPFQYNPATGVLRVYSEMTVEIFATGPGKVNVLEQGVRHAKHSLAFQDIYATQFENYESSVLYDPIDEEGEMLIIAHDPWVDMMAPFVAHKVAMGISATVVGVSTIGNNSTAIKNHIQGVYDTSDLAYVLIVGDISQVSSPMVLGGGSDPSYAKLAGNDDYPEIVVGRFSANTEAELLTQLQRTIDYETLPALDQDWFHKGTGIASAEGAGMGDEGQSDKQHMMEIRDWLLGAGYTEVDEIYDPGASASAVSAALNSGRGVLNYVGHGWPQGFSTTGFDSGNVHALTNDNMLPFVISVACNTGEFESYNECFAEAWMRATHDGEPTGAIGMYASSISQYWAEPMEAQDEFNLLLTDPGEPYASFGAMCYAASSSMMDDYGNAGVDMFDTWIVFGDPSLRVIGEPPPSGMIVDPPMGLNAKGRAGGPFTPQVFHYTLENLDDTPIDYQVGTMAPWLRVLNGRGTIPGRSSVVVTVTIDETARNYDNGHYEALLSFVNLTDDTGSTVRDAALDVGIPLIQQRWDFDVQPGWTIGPRWSFGQPTGQGGLFAGNPDPTSGATGDNVFGVNLNGDFMVMISGPYYVTMEPVDLSGTFGATLAFERWLNSEGSPLTTSTIEVSSDGIDWTPVWTAADDIMDSAWTLQTYDIAALTDDRPTVQVRWGFSIDSQDALPCSGWNIDDVKIWAATESTARIDLSLDGEGLSWNAVAGALSYDVVRGDLQLLRDSGGDFTAATVDCIGNDIEGNWTPFDGDPEAGNGFWVLVRGVAEAGTMSYQALYDSQVDIRDEEIEAAAGSCP